MIKWEQLDRKEWRRRFQLPHYQQWWIKNLFTILLCSPQQCLQKQFPFSNWDAECGKRSQISHRSNWRLHRSWEPIGGHNQMPQSGSKNYGPMILATGTSLSPRTVHCVGVQFSDKPALTKVRQVRVELVCSCSQRFGNEKLYIVLQM